jgi:glycosyltransferase involved in cell wall biosynthesis
VAFRKGALPEVVREGVTGFLVEDVSQAVSALQQVGSISSTACVQHAQENFSAAKMAERYFQLYQRVTDSEKVLRFAQETA